ncbi:hypothetical protein V5799_009195 [Amblyomma americanum]|uniref:Uncharacterized protein n=1 Tax=Amblyomma americanum TaxID=6943 RepID=A0AAQ4FBD0_AMBAM
MFMLAVVDVNAAQLEEIILPENLKISWPYGRVISTGGLIWELKESHGCKDNETKCFTECNRLGVKGAFCGHKDPHHCFCEAYIPPSFWDAFEVEMYQTNEDGITTCNSTDICDSYCLSRSYSGGFCPQDEPTKCYCYFMYPYRWFPLHRSTTTDLLVLTTD